MSKLRDALSVLPARPAIFIAPLIVLVVLSLYYRDRYEQCRDIREDRQTFTETIRSLESGDQFRLADLTDFSWNKVRIVSHVKPGTISEVCPFGWNWSNDERETLLANGLLTAVIFGHQGRVVKYLELRGDELKFPARTDILSPDNAVFHVIKSQSSDLSVTLTLHHSS